MEHGLTLAIMIISLLLLIFSPSKKTHRFLETTHRPNKFYSEGDTLHLGTFQRSNFVLLFYLKVNAPQMTLLSFNSSQLKVENKNLIYDQTTIQLPFSLYEIFRWVQIGIHSNPTLEILINGKPYPFPVSIPNSFSLTLGDKTFSGMIAGITINSTPIFLATVAGANQHRRQKISVAGFNDFGLFGNEHLYSQLVQRGHSEIQYPLALFRLAKDISFSLNCTFRILSDGIYFTLFFPDSKKITVGRNIINPTATKSVDLKEMNVGLFDVLKFIVNLSNPSILFIKNITNNSELQKPLPEPPTPEYAFQPGDSKVCLFYELIHHEKPVWQAGINFEEQNNTSGIFQMDYTGAYVRILNPPRFRLWTCEFEFLLKSKKEICILYLKAENHTLGFSIKGSQVLLLHIKDGKQFIDNVDVAEPVYSQRVKISLAYDLYFTIQISFAEKNFQRNIFLPSARDLFQTSEIFFGSLNSLNPTVPDPQGQIFLLNLFICNIPFRDLPEKIVVKDTSTILGSISSVEIPFSRNTLVFSLQTNKTIGIFIRDSNVYLVFDHSELLIQKSLVAMPGMYKFQLKLDTESVLLITNPRLESISFRFTAFLLPTRVAAMKLSSQTCTKAVFLGSVCCL